MRGEDPKYGDVRVLSSELRFFGVRERFRARESRVEIGCQGVHLDRGENLLETY